MDISNNWTNLPNGSASSQSLLAPAIGNPRTQQPFVIIRHFYSTATTVTTSVPYQFFSQNHTKLFFNQTNVTLTAPMSNNLSQTIIPPLWGSPGFCSLNAKPLCSNQTLRQCASCDMGMAAVFIAFTALLGFLIVFGNCHVILFTLKKKPGFTGIYGKIKASLAFADLLSGLQIFFVTMYNVSWTINSTSIEINKATEQYEGSWQAYLGGIFYLLSFTASMHHLIFLGVQRLYAIRWPIRYKHQSSVGVYIGLAVVWFIAVLIPIVPTWFPDKFVYSYSPTIFLFNITMTKRENLYILLIMIILLFVVPYIIMTGITVVTGIYVGRYVVGRSKKLHQRRSLKKDEVWMFVTVAIMQLGFTVTLLPVFVFVMLANTKNLDEAAFSKYYLAGFYSSMSNSLVNVMVYSLMDSKFRKAISDMISICYTCSARGKLSTSVRNSTTTKKVTTSKNHVLSTVETPSSTIFGAVVEAD